MKSLLVACILLLSIHNAFAFGFDLPPTPFTERGRNELLVQRLKTMQWKTIGNGPNGESAYLGDVSYSSKAKSITYWLMLSSPTPSPEGNKSVVIGNQTSCNSNSVISFKYIYWSGELLAGRYFFDSEDKPTLSTRSPLDERIAKTYCKY